jgi:hypothetical protein
MSISLKKLWNDYGIGAIIILLIVAYGVSLFGKYLNDKGSYGNEYMTQQTNSAYYNPQSSESSQPSQSSQPSGPQPSNPLGQNEVFSSANGVSTSQNMGIPSSCNKATIQNPSDLLPKDNNNQWAQLNPSGKGELANINLLKAGYHIGIDTIGQTLRNANLQIRSEPPNPQLYVGPWQNSTITPDFMRPVLEINSQ